MMAVLRIKDASGKEVLNLSNSITRVVGTIETASVNGQLSSPALKLGKPFYMFMPLNENQYGSISENYASPIVAFSDSVMSWSYGAFEPAARVNGIIIYGTY